MQEIIRATQSGEVSMDVGVVIASASDVGGIKKARDLGLEEGKNIVVVNPDNFRGDDGKVDRDGFGKELNRVLQQHGVTVVTQNGWLPLTPHNVIERFPETIFNQHPGPVPEFGGKGMYGKRVHAARLLFVRETKRDFWTTAIAQRVDVNFDQGAVVKSAQVPILPEDTVDDLQQRVLPVEHRVQISLLRDVAAGNVRVVSDREMLVRPGEEQILSQVKKTARMLYPEG